MSKNYCFAQFYKNYDPKTVVFFCKLLTKAECCFGNENHQSTRRLTAFTCLKSLNLMLLLCLVRLQWYLSCVIVFILLLRLFSPKCCSWLSTPTSC